MVVVAAGLLAACGSGDGDASSSPNAFAAPTERSNGQPDAESANASGEPCGVTLAEVESLLPADSGVAQNETPDRRRCNFTWDDGGPRGMDVALVPGGRTSFNAPASFQPVDGYGDEAFLSTEAQRVSAVAFVGNDLYAVDVTSDGGGGREDLRDLCLQLLELALDPTASSNERREP